MSFVLWFIFPLLGRDLRDLLHSSGLGDPESLNQRSAVHAPQIDHLRLQRGFQQRAYAAKTPASLLQKRIWLTLGREIAIKSAASICLENLNQNAALDPK